MAEHPAASSCLCPKVPRAVETSSTEPESARNVSVRAVQSSRDRAEQHAGCNSPECRFARAEQAPRTRESVQAERSERDLRGISPADRPLAAHRPDHARAFFETLTAFGVSKNRAAEMLGINEKQIRKMLDGRSSIQSTVASALPVDMALDFLSRLSALRGVSKSGMQREIDRLAKARDLRGVLDAQRQLLELATKLSAGDR